MRFLSAIIYACCPFLAVSATANDIDGLLLQRGEDAQKYVMSEPEQDLAIRHNLTKRLAVEFNFNAFGAQSTQAQRSVNKARPLVQPLKLGNGTLSITGTMKLRFSLKF